MNEPSASVQKLIVARLWSESELSSFIPIMDRSGRPEKFPVIIVGDAHVTYPDYAEEFHIVVSSDVHIWTEEPNLASVKSLAALARNALFHGPWNVDGFNCVNLRLESTRFLRDPDNRHSHAILNFNVILQESIRR